MKQEFNYGYRKTVGQPTEALECCGMKQLWINPRCCIRQGVFEKVSAR